MSEKFCLKWNDYQSNWNKALHDLQKDTEFADVTLISDDKVKFPAHKILLSSCSNLFKFILKGNGQLNSLMYLSGVNSLNLGFILDFIYNGEVSIYQEQLDSFLLSAKMLEIEGLLSGDGDSHENLNEENHLLQVPKHENCDKYEQDEENSLVKIDTEVNKMNRPYSRALNKVAKIDVRSLTSEEIDSKMRELYEKTDEGWNCLVCDYTKKESGSTSIRKHIEIHVDGLVYTCNVCSKEFRSRNILKMHKSRNHRLN